MDSITQRFIRANELTTEQAWELVTWCADHGGDEFSIQFLRFRDNPASAHKRFWDDLAKFHCGKTKRERGAKRIEMETWLCCPESIERLRAYFPEGLLARPSYAEEGWFEDLTVYREGEIMFGIVNHEGAAVIRLIDGEHRKLSDLKIKSYDSAA